MPAGVGIDEVDRRVAAKGRYFFTAEVICVGSIEITQPLRVDDIDRGCGVLELINEAKVGHLAEVEERFGSCVQFFRLHPAAIEPLAEISEVVWIGLESLVIGVCGKNSYLKPVHGGRVLRDLAKLFKHPCGVNVDDEDFAGTFAGPIGGDDAVDVLRGRKQERDVLLLSNCLEDCVFDRRLVREEVVVSMQHGAFEEEDIDVADWALHEIIEEYSLSAMRAKIAAVEQALAFSFDEKGIGIGGGVVDEIRSDSEITDVKRLPGLEVVKVERIPVFAAEHQRGIDQTAGQLADVDRSAERQCCHQAKVVLVRMADQKGIHGKARKIYGRAVRAEWKSGIKKDAAFSG